MKKRAVLKIIRFVLTLITVLAVACAVTVTGGGFLDLSDLVRAVCIGIAVACGLLAVVMWKCAEPKDP